MQMRQSRLESESGYTLIPPEVNDSKSGSAVPTPKNQDSAICGNYRQVSDLAGLQYVMTRRIVSAGGA